VARLNLIQVHSAEQASYHARPERSYFVMTNAKTIGMVANLHYGLPTLIRIIAPRRVDTVEFAAEQCLPTAEQTAVYELSRCNTTPH